MKFVIDPAIKLDPMRRKMRAPVRYLNQALEHMPADAAPGIPPHGDNLLVALMTYTESLPVTDPFRRLRAEVYEYLRSHDDVNQIMIPRMQVTPEWMDELFILAGKIQNQKET